MTDTVRWALQALILTTGIFFILRVVRTTRGSRIVRGFLLAIVVGFLGLWYLADALELEELSHIIQGITGFVAVIFAILFQPELRRGIAQLGTGALLGRLMTRLGRDSIRELCQAVVAMSKRKHGALIAVERENPLDAYIEGGVAVDGSVNRLLIESIFQPGGPLHDGAVIVRKDRVAAACSLFPLTENLAIARSTGTRHRAALGLTDETDAVTIAVSEETGGISVCKRGRMQSRVAPGRLEDVVREAVGPDQGPEGGTRGTKRALVDFLRFDLLWFGAAVVLAASLLLLANLSIRQPDTFNLRLVPTYDATRQPQPGELLLVLPSADHRLDSEGTTAPVQVQVTGTRGQLADVRRDACGSMAIDDTGANEWIHELRVEGIEWSRSLPGVRFDWAPGEEARQVLVRLFGSRRVDLSAGLLDVDDDDLDARFVVDTKAATFEPPFLMVRGPARELPKLGTAELPLALQAIVLSRNDLETRVRQVRLDASMAENDFAIEAGGGSQVTLPIAPARFELELITKEIALTCLDATRMDEVGGWQIPLASRTAEVRIFSVGLIREQDAAEQVARQRRAIRDWVDANLLVFVDIAAMTEGGGTTVEIQWSWRGGKDWRDHLGEMSLDIPNLGTGERLELELVDSFPIKLERAGTEGE